MSEIIEDKASQSMPAWLESWPADELEHMSTCPVCGSTARELQQRDLVDNAFFVAPGRWTLYRCTRCRSAYLDPRPSEASIGKAYGVYYTHGASGPRTTSGSAGMVSGLKQALNNGYVNSRYGTRRQPASRLGVWLARLLPLRRQRRDAEFRYLPKPRPGQTLLDIGCGNGDFLINARDAGWDVAGVDPDPRAVAAARQRGLEVETGSIELFAGASSCFDAITLSHVLEHLHDPAPFLRAVHRLLKTDGVLFIDTPNIDSRGARRWGRNWRGLETPRHLVLFSRQGLIGMLEAGGFGDIEAKRRTAVRKSMDLASLRMQLGKSPDGNQPRRLPAMMRLRRAWPLADPGGDEFLTLVARKVSA